MMMSEEEILKSYDEAQNKSQQIGILADLNVTDKKEIREILKNNGREVPYGRKVAQTKEGAEPEEKKETGNPRERKEEIPDSVRDVLEDELDRIRNEIQRLFKRQEEIDGFLRRKHDESRQDKGICS